MRALIVDDSGAMRKILRRVLSGCGFDDIADAENGLRALDVLGAGPVPAFAFVDWNMPEMSGIELVRAIRADSRFDAMAVVMVTSETAFENIQVAIDAGADEYVMKPFTTDIISDKLALVRANRG
jgi:two-component system chemotaxis response regulator CheY